jgi:polyphosphate kinase
VDPGHPFPFISNLSTSLAVVLGHPKRDTDEPLFSRIKIPEFINGYISLPDFSCTGVHRFISTIDLIQAKIEWLFPGMIIMASTPFRLTRNAELFHDVLEMDDLMEHMSSVLKEQKFASVVRLEHLQGADPWTIQFIKRELNLISADVVELMDALHFSSLTIICDLSLKKLRFSKWIPVIPEVFKSKLSIFDVLKKQDILVHHPYESFKHSVEYFLKVCAADPKVKSIKMTLYRTGDHSPFINALIGAAESGKQVVCLVELKARFDEKRNMRWAHALEDVGIHVVYGIMGLKTHSKLCLVVREEEFGEYKTYAHVGTGNYHSQTANIYTDLGLFTSDERVTSEVMEVFNYLTGRSLKDDYKHLLVAPLTMKKQFLELISREKNNALEGKPAQIIAKMNSLEDDEITRALYSASQAGVIVTMYVRGFCCLKPQIKGLSENIRVYSLLGRFLEHSRFFIFQAGAESLLKGSFYMGSADWMYRNMHARVEVITPIYDLKAKEKILDLCKVMEADMESKWELDARGVYIKPALKKDEASSTQVVLMQRTLQK